MALEGLTASVNDWLARQHVTVLDEWVKACVEWLQSEYKEALNNPSELQQLVYEQWLDSNLADVSTPCLPNGLAQQQKIELNGNYILQINSLRDVSTPAYSQLIKLRGQENDNAKVTATQQTQSHFEPKSNRMLLLDLTDGHQTIQGMEFQPVPGLNVNTSPGTKIQVCGNVQCRLGVLLLSPANVRVLGGEVDALVQENNQDAVLAQALGQAPIPLDQQTTQQNQQNQVQLPQQQQPQQRTGNPIIDLTEDPPGKYNNRQPSVPPAVNPQPVNPIIEDDPFMDDGFGDDDDDFDDVMLQGLQEIELQQGQHSTNDQPSNQQSAHHVPAQPQPKPVANAPFTNMTFNSCNINIITKQTSTSNIQQNAAKPPRLGQQNPPANRNQQTGGSVGTVQGSTMNHRLSGSVGQSGTNPNPNPNLNPGRRPFLGAAPVQDSRSNVTGPGGGTMISALSGKQSKRGFVKFNSSSHQESRPATTSSTCQPFQRTSEQVDNAGSRDRKPVVNPAFKSETKPVTASRGFLQANTVVKPDLHRTTSNQFQSAGVAVKTEQCQIESDRVDPGASSSNQFQSAGKALAVKSEPCRTGFNKFQPTSSTSNQFRSTERTVNVKNEPGVSGIAAQRSTIEGGSSPHEDDSVMAKRRRFHSGQSSACDSIHLPFSTLVIATQKWEAKETCVMNIKGFIMTLLSPLTCKRCWNVHAKINDGTASMDVDLGNEVLTELIGFSVTELAKMKREASTASPQRASELKNNMKQGLEKCQKALVDISCIMTLEIRPDYERPRVLSFRNVNDSDCLALIQQL